MFVHLSIFYGWVRIYIRDRVEKNWMFDVYIYAIELRKIGCLFSFSYVSIAIVHL